jgi:hypothetical protein
MWILPKNYQLSSAYAADMVASKEDLTLQGLNIESSLMWRSKPSPLRTWLTRWKKDSYLPHLYTRILKPSRRKSFETELALLLEVIPANRLVKQEKEKEKKTRDTFGHLFGNTLEQLDLLGASLKMSKDTSRLDSTASLAIWKKIVTEQRGEYLVRVKSARRTKEKESTSWPTATVFDVTGGSYPTELVNGQWRSKHSKDPNSPWYGAKLKDAVETAERFPTPGTTECRSDTLNLVNRVMKGKQIMLTHHVRLYPTPSARDWKDSPGMAKTATNPNGSERKRNDQLARAVYATENPLDGQLNPDWVEWLMGVPTGWTELDF